MDVMQQHAQRLPVSTVLLTRNSASTLSAYFASMREVDDIILLDGGSVDETLALAKHESNVRIFSQDPRFLDGDGRIIDFSGMRNWGYTLARHKWILCVDADESASPKLLEEVRRIVEEGKPGAYYAKRTFYLGDRPIIMLKRSTMDQIRLFHFDAVEGCVRPVHERVAVKPGAYRGVINDEVRVLVVTGPAMRRKYDRYLGIEAGHLRGISFGRWFRWIFLRNLLSIVRRTLVVIAVRLLPKPGPRYPLSLEYEQLRYNWLLIWRTCPLWR